MTGIAVGDTTTIDLATGSAVRIDGAASDDFAGRSVADAGDVNGDGRDDLLIGAPTESSTARGAVYVVFGRATWPSVLDLAALGAGGFRIDGEAASEPIGTVIAGGDVSGDGYADILVGQPWADHNGTNSGSVQVVLGGPTPPPVIDLGDLAGLGYRIDGAAAGDRVGSAVTVAGDVNDDGRDDILLGATGADNLGRTDAGSGYVVYGTATPPAVLDLSTLGFAGFRIDGANVGDWAGRSVASAGDLNADGFDDVLIAAANTDHGGTNTGSVYAVYGRAGSSPVDLAGLDTGGFRIDGTPTGPIGPIGPGADLNGDGRKDVLLGAGGFDGPGGTDAGRVYVVLGSADPPAVRSLDALGSAGYTVDGGFGWDHLGEALAAGDINGDGIADLVAGAYGVDRGEGPNCGAAYVVHGSTHPVDLSAGSLGTAGFRILGAAPADQNGRSVTAADVNGDTAPDVVTAAPVASTMRPNSGSVYVVFGTPPPLPTASPTTSPTASPTPTATPMPAASLRVKARPARTSVPRDGKAVLVKRATVGAGQTKTIRVKVTPKRARKSVTVTVTRGPGRVKARTDGAPKARITVRIRATGPGVTPATWARSWKVR